MVGVSRPQSGLVYGVYIDGILCAVESVQIDVPLKDVPLAVFDVAATHGKRMVEDRDSAKALRIKDLKSQITSAQKTVDTPVTEGDFDAALKQAEAKRAITRATAELEAIDDPLKGYVQENLTWRHLQPNAKVVILFRDTNWDSKYPRFVVFFEGEVMSTGFSRSPNGRTVKFQAYHITQGLEYTEMEILDGGTANQEVITNETRNDGVASTFDITGNFLTALSPPMLAQRSRREIEDLDIHSFCKESFNVFLDSIANSPVRNNYYAKAIKFYDMVNRMNSPEDRLSNIRWSEVYQYIMEYTFKNLMPALGTRISYFNLISYISQVFLHEFMIHPASTSVKSQILIKPRNVFMPVPNCNILFPIHGFSYSHRETYKQKPTRHKLTLDPPYGKKIGPLQKYYTVYSPKILRDRIRAVEGADATTIQNSDLITDEEKERGIIPSYNTLPSIITSLLELLTVTDANGNIIDNPAAVKGAGENYSPSESNGSTISGSNLSNDQIEAISNKMEIHKKLLVLEGFIKEGANLPKGELAIHNSTGESLYKYKPNRITIVPMEKIIKLSDKVENKKKVNYTIMDGKVKRVLGRQFHIFEEPTDSIPLMIKINEDSGVLQTLNKQSKFLIGGTETTGAKLDKKYELKSSIDRRVHTKTMIDYVTGGFHQSLVIAVDSKENSKKALIDLVALLCQLCDIPLDLASNKGNVRFLSDYFGEGFVTENIDEELKKAVSSAKAVKSSLIPAVVKDSSSQEAGLGQVRVSGERDMDAKLTAILSVNEASGEVKYRVGYNRLTSSRQDLAEFVFGGAQFTMNPSFTRPEWYKIGLSNTEVSALQNIVKKKYRSVTAMPYDDQKTIQAATAKIKQNRDLVDKLDINQRKILIIHTISQLRKHFPNCQFEGYSIFGQLCDIFNQWGEGVIDSHYQTSMPLLRRDNKVTKDNILAWRYASADHAKSTVTRHDQKRRHDNIERLYKDNPGGFMYLDELLKSVGDTSNLTLKDTGSNIMSTGVVYTDSNLSNSGVSGNGKANNIKVSNMNISELTEHYAEPVADYHFYETRYASNQDNLSIAFNPYLYPGYPCLILDNSELKAHITGYVQRVSYVQHSSGNLSTNVSLGFMRRADKLGLTRDLALTHGADVDGVVPTNVPESLKDRIPFFGGEYAEEYINDTYKRLIGCERAQLDPVPEHYMDIRDLKEANQQIRRTMQYCKMVDAGDNQTYYDDIYKDNPSMIAAVFNGNDFPEEIHFINDMSLVQNITTSEELLAKDESGVFINVKDDLAFNPSTRELVKNHNNIVNFKRAQKG